MIARSGVPGIVWPAVPDRAGALLLAMEHQLEDSQWLPLEDLQALQFEGLAGLLEHACRTVPHYRDDPGYGRLMGRPVLTAEDWSSLPILSRAEVQEAGPDLASEAVPPSHLPLCEVVTSGSTGRPVRATATAVTNLFWKAITLRDHMWHGRALTGRLAAIRADLNNKLPPEGVELGSWGPATDAVYPTGPCGLLGIRHDVAAQAAWLVAQDPDYLLTYPSNLLALAQHFRRTGGRLPRLREACTYGESLSAEVRPLCDRTWGVRIVDVYSTQELGYLALQCPRSERYHVQAESVYLEVVDERGDACGPGETGRVIVTTLHNYAMPFIRYELGDYAEVGPPCPCGRGLPVLTRIVGRQRNMWALPGGQQVWPMFSSKDWGHIDAIRQLQLVQHELDLIEARIVGPRPLTSAEENEVTALLRREFAHPFRLSFRYVDDVERTPSRKFEDFVSRVPGPEPARAGRP